MAPKKKKNISALFDQAFTLEDSHGNEWEMRPPNKLRGMNLAVLYAGISHIQRSGGPCKACGHVGTEGMEPKTAAAWDSLQEREFEEIVFGKPLYDQMLEADVPASDMYQMAVYTMRYWVVGEEQADLMADTYAQSLHKVNADGTEMDEETARFMDPKAPATPKPSKSGPSTD